ncbi:hypothetical protein G5714_023133 [Onychostoma macrolepis]|uniref:Ig-like domain-containing protein n=1 Tax=Onychostoma macrolepis TaxID=369639 RepID=A0A7J6BK76_9TELE|nr:hypothetical protein G5714_023133 [Onychostoma macrolepis]
MQSDSLEKPSWSKTDNEALWWTLGGGTELVIRTGPAVKPSVSLLPPSSLQISGDSAALLCLLSSYSPQGAQVSWTLDGSEVTEGVQTSAESERDGRYSRSSVLSLSKARWEDAQRFVCRVTHDGAAQETSFLKSSSADVSPVKSSRIHSSHVVVRDQTVELRTSSGPSVDRRGLQTES